MKFVLLSGGSGKRLWPLSNSTRSKQFLKVLTSPKKEPESMVQRVWRQLTSVGLSSSCYVAAGKSQLDNLQNQLGSSIPVIIEPQCRDTFPAIVLAASYLYSKENVCLDEVIGFLPVDPYVEEQFFKRINELENILLTSKSEIALIGVPPVYPSEKYGYIVPEREGQDFNQDFVKVSHFVEKPNQEDARKLIEKQALWNCGVFAFKLGFIISKLESLGLPVKYDALLQEYEKLPKISFDIEVLEKTEHIVVATYTGFWKDLGTWNTLTEEMAEKTVANGIVGIDSANTHIINELNIPMIILGIANAIVVASPDGILVADKTSSAKIKGLVEKMNQRPMYEERRWGWYRVLDHTHFENEREVLTKRIGVYSGKNLSYQKHFKRSEVWTIISGEGEFALNDQLITVKPGDVLKIPVGARHGIKAITDLEFIEVQTGSQLIEEDIVRIFMTWEEVRENCKRK